MQVPFFQAKSPARSHGVEAIATLREVALMRRDILTVLPKAYAGDDVVVLVHGFFASAGVFRPMRARLEKEADARVASFSHAPGWGVRRIARQLSELVDRIPQGTRIHLVGHSLGGLVARWYVQEMGGHQRVAQTISLATPFHGTRLARLRFLVGNDLHMASTLLDRIRERAHAYDVPHTSIIGTSDVIVQPTHSAKFHHGDAIVLEGRGHNTLLFDQEAIDLVVNRVIAARAV
jgi:pimeloyl-ACP methyl ester carboxylesterase